MIRRLFTTASVLSLVLAWPALDHAAGPPRSAPAESPYAPVGRVDGAAHGVHSPFTCDGRAFVTAAGDAVRVWDAATLRSLTGPLPHPGLRFYRLASAGDTLLTANADEVRVWDVASGRLRSATRVSRR
ncbi:MAG TPA: hypothetical protein VGI81_28885, partial [Tepidisphaeraceae bacterium]